MVICICCGLHVFCSYPVLVMCYQHILSFYDGTATTKSLIIKSTSDTRDNHSMLESFPEVLCTQDRFREGKEIYLK